MLKGRTWIVLVWSQLGGDTCHRMIEFEGRARGESEKEAQEIMASQMLIKTP